MLALYINSPEVTALYARPKMIWLLCVLVLYWISRVWMQAQRGEMHDDPVVFALEDRPSLAVGVLALITTMAAIGRSWRPPPASRHNSGSLFPWQAAHLP